MDIVTFLISLKSFESSLQLIEQHKNEWCHFSFVFPFSFLNLSWVSFHIHICMDMPMKCEVHSVITSFHSSQYSHSLNPTYKYKAVHIYTNQWRLFIKNSCFIISIEKSRNYLLISILRIENGRRRVIHTQVIQDEKDHDDNERRLSLPYSHILFAIGSEYQMG